MATVHRGAFISADSVRAQKKARRRLLAELYHYLKRAGFSPRSLFNRSVWVRGDETVRIESCHHQPQAGGTHQLEIRIYFDSALRDDARFGPVLSWVGALHAHHYR